MARNFSEGKERLQELASGHPLRLLLKYSWPALVAMTLNALYAVVDRFYIGQGCGEDAMAALTLCFPVMMLMGAFGVFVGAGHAAVLSIKLGEGARITCEKLLGQLIAIKLLFFCTLVPLLFINLDTILGWCGGHGVTPQAFAYAQTYLQIVLFSHLFSHLSFGLSALMRAEGAAKRSMACMIVGFGTNLILDPIFIFGLNLGIVGAAWATNIAMFASCVYAFSFYWREKSLVRLRWRRIGIYPKLLAKPCGIGFAPFLQHFLGACINVVLPASFARWAGSEAAATTQIASLGVFQSVMILMVMPIMGAQQGLQPILGYNWGARNFKRVKSTLLLGFLITTILCVLATLVQCVPPFPTWLASAFVSADNPVLRAVAARDLSIANCMLWCIGLNVVATTYFQSIGHPKAAIVLSTLRQGACLLPLAWFLPYFFENHALGVWLALPVSDVLCCLMTILPLGLHYRFLTRVRERKGLIS